MVEAINHETRSVTLRTPEGTTLTFTAGGDVRNLAQVETGDIVTYKYVYNLTIEVVENPGRTPSKQEISAVTRAEKGEKPGMIVTDAQVVTATVEEINVEENTFKLKWPDESVEQFTARDPANLKKASEGDLVIITQREKLAISVDESPAE